MSEPTTFPIDHDNAPVVDAHGPGVVTDDLVFGAAFAYPE